MYFFIWLYIHTHIYIYIHLVIYFNIHIHALAVAGETMSESCSACNSGLVVCRGQSRWNRVLEFSSVKLMTKSIVYHCSSSIPPRVYIQISSSGEARQQFRLVGMALAQDCSGLCGALQACHSPDQDSSYRRVTCRCCRSCAQGEEA